MTDESSVWRSSSCKNKYKCKRNIFVDDAIDFEFDENDSDNSFDLDLGAESHVSCLFFTNVFFARIGSYVINTLVAFAEKCREWSISIMLK